VDSSEPLEVHHFEEFDAQRDGEIPYERPVSPVTPEVRSRPQTPESPEQPRYDMAEASGTGGGTTHLITDEMFQTLLRNAGREQAPRSSHPKLRDPEPYDGEQVKLRPFLAHCELKFQTEEIRYDTDGKKTGYAGALLRGVAWSWLEPMITQAGGLNMTWDEFKISMGHAFGEVNTEEVAYEKFQKIQQGNRTAAAYWAEFQKIKADLPYSDNICIARFRAGLHSEVRRHLVMSETPATVLVDYATAAIKADSRLCHLGVITRRSTTQPEPRFHAGPKEVLAAGDPMDLDATRRYRFARRFQRPYVKKTGDECYNCGEKGHFSRDCSQPKKPRFPGRKPYRAAEATYEENLGEVGTEPEPSGNDGPQE
jgi:Retrotransposon gag protein/Zinc knuckle